jgi:hypothetical protein
MNYSIYEVFNWHFAKRGLFKTGAIRFSVKAPLYEITRWGFRSNLFV